MKHKNNFIAYDAGNCESETFATFEEAQNWLRESDSKGISPETQEGYSYIAKVTHRSYSIITDRKANYHEHTDSCPKDCDEEEWPYDSDYDEVGRVSYVPIEELPDGV